MAPLGGLNSKTGSSDFRLGLGAFVGGKKERKMIQMKVVGSVPGKQCPGCQESRHWMQGDWGLNDVTPP